MSTIAEIIEREVAKAAPCSCAYIKREHPDCLRQECNWCDDFGMARNARAACLAVATVVAAMFTEAFENDTRRLIPKCDVLDVIRALAAQGPGGGSNG